MLEALPVCKADKGRYDFPMIILPQGKSGGRTVKTAAIVALSSFGRVYSPRPLPAISFSLQCKYRMKKKSLEQAAFYFIRILNSSSHNRDGLFCSHGNLPLPLLSVNKPTIVLPVYRT